MEYAVFVIGVIALIISVVISQKISKCNEEEIAVLKAELLSYIELNTDKRFMSNHAYFEGKYDVLNQKINETMFKAQDNLQNIEDCESTLNDHEDRIYEVESNTEKLESKVSELQEQMEVVESNIETLRSNLTVIKPTAPWIQQDYATYLENDASVIVHLDAATYELDDAIIFMAYMLQDLKDKVYGKKIVTHEEPKTNTRRKKIPVSGDTNNTTKGS